MYLPPRSKREGRRRSKDRRRKRKGSANENWGERGVLRQAIPGEDPESSLMPS